MDKLKRKQYMFGVLKTLAYFVGFPLVIVAVLIASNQFMHYDLFARSWYVAILFVAIPWLIVGILQILLGCFVKSQNIKTIVVAIIVVAVMVGSGLVIDVYGTNRIKKAQETYSEQKYLDAGVVINDYKYQVNWYITRTTEDSLLDEFKARVDLFTAIYHLKQNGELYGDELNTDGSQAKKNSTEKGLGLTNVYTSPNGLLADGWTFSVQNAIDIMIAYHEVNNKAAKLGLDMEEEYQRLIALVEESPEYQAYMETDEYQAAYGENGTAYDHMITEDRVNEMLPVVAKFLSKAIFDIANIIPGNEVGDLGILYGMINDYLPIDEMSKLQTLDELIEYVNKQLPKIAGLLDGFVGAESNPLNGLTLDKAFVLDLLKEYSYYYSPTARPVFDFIAEATDGNELLICDYYNDEGEVVLSAKEVQRFAYARYYAKVHGANVGSVLIGENIGNVTMNFSGYPAESCAFTLAELYQMDADLSYIPSLYPDLAARRILFMFAGIVVLSVILFYQFGKKQDDIIEEIIITKGGSRS